MSKRLSVRTAAVCIVLSAGAVAGDTLETDPLSGHPNRVVLQPGECASTATGGQTLQWFCAAGIAVVAAVEDPAGNRPLDATPAGSRSPTGLQPQAQRGASAALPLEARLEEAETQTQALQARLDAAETGNQALQAQLAQARAQTDAVRAEAERAAAAREQEQAQRAATQREALAALQARLDAAETETQALQAQLAQAQAQADAVRAGAERAAAAWEQEMAQREAQLRDALEDYTKALDVIRSHEVETEDRRRRTRDVVARNIMLERQVATYRRLLGDSDQDGVVDALDLCAASAQGLVVDRTGCPAETEIVLQGVRFGPNSAQLTAASRRVLDGVATRLAQHPDLRFEVGGHTDSTGDTAVNLDISLRRANRVRDYLIARGVGAAGLLARGYGQTRPIADNGSGAGRAQNRRVTLRRID